MAYSHAVSPDSKPVSRYPCFLLRYSHPMSPYSSRVSPYSRRVSRYSHRVSRYSRSVSLDSPRFESVLTWFESVLTFCESRLTWFESVLGSGESVLTVFESVLIFFEYVLKLKNDRGALAGSESPHRDGPIAIIIPTVLRSKRGAACQATLLPLWRARIPLATVWPMSAPATTSEGKCT